MVDCFALCLVEILGFFMFHNIVNNCFSFFSVSLLLLYPLRLPLCYRTFNICNQCWLWLHHLSRFTFSFNLLCTIVNYTQMFSPFNTPMFEMLTPTLMLKGKFNLSLNFSSLQSNPTQPWRSLFGSLKNKNIRDSSSSNWRISYTKTFLT